MKALALRRKEASPAVMTETVLCHDVRDARAKIVAAKGARLDAALVERVLGASWDEIHLLVVEDGDLHEEEAGARLAAAVVGEGVVVKGYSGGQWTLVATRRGLLGIRQAALLEVNALDGISVFTLWDGQPVEPGEVVAKAKVTPLVIPQATISGLETTAGQAGGLVRVRGFAPAVVAVVARENLDPGQRARFETAVRQKIDWFGSELLPLRFAAGSVGAVAAELQAARAAGATLLVVAGASALDPLDPVFGALALVGARMERHGAPAHPGSLLWVAEWEGRPVVGMPTCGMFSQATTFDLVLPRFLAGERIGNREIAALGHGGLLSRDMAYRFPPYRADRARGELE